MNSGPAKEAIERYWKHSEASFEFLSNCCPRRAILQSSCLLDNDTKIVFFIYNSHLSFQLKLSCYFNPTQVCNIVMIVNLDDRKIPLI